MCQKTQVPKNLELICILITPGTRPAFYPWQMETQNDFAQIGLSLRKFTPHCYPFMRLVSKSYQSTLAVSIFFLLLPFFSRAQATPQDIRPMLKSLSRDEKLRLLEYLRHLGAGMDQEIQKTYELLGPQEQTKAVRYIESVKAATATREKPVTTVVWDRDTIYFGNISEGTPVIDSFMLTNTGYEPYQIYSTKTTCDCTVLKAPAHPVMPGESAIFRVEFNSYGKRGAAIPAIIVYDNSSPNNRSILYLKGDIGPRKRPRKNPWQD